MFHLGVETAEATFQNMNIRRPSHENRRLAMLDKNAHGLLAAIYLKARVIQNGKFWTTVNAFTDQTEALPPQTLTEIGRAMVRRIDPATSIILGEEDKGAHIATTVSLLTGIPLVLARHYTYPIQKAHPAAISTNIKHEYFEGSLVVNGLRSGQVATIIEDTVSTGGTTRGLSAACKRASVKVVGMITAVEKTNYGGRQVVKACFGLELAAILRVRVSERGVEVVSKHAWETGAI